METAVYVLAALLILTVAALSVNLILTTRALAKAQDRDVLLKTLTKFSDRMVMDKDQQIERAKMEAQVEMGADYMHAQTEIEKLRSRRGGNRLNGQVQTPPPADVRVEMEE
jgi:hypothetical protein